MTLPRSTLAVVTGALALAFCCVQVAAGASGGAAPGQTTSGGSGSAGGSTGGGGAQKPSKTKRRPVLAAWALSDTTLSDGRTMTARYRITATAKKVRVRGIVRTKSGRYIKTLELGVHSTNTLITTKLTPDELRVSRAGAYKLRLTARDGKKRAAKRAKGVPAWREFSFSDHRFPVVGHFSFGGEGAKFGAGRPGHTHQGQDVVADSGTPIVAPYSGSISYVAYQAAGAGYYVVEHSDDGRDYVFMHLLKGSTAVALGDHVKTGQRLGLVGATGDASGPHLHFEVWTGGPWQFGGKPVDPLPLLRSWYAGGAGGAVRTSAVAASAVAPRGPLD